MQHIHEVKCVMKILRGIRRLQVALKIKKTQTRASAVSSKFNPLLIISGGTDRPIRSTIGDGENRTILSRRRQICMTGPTLRWVLFTGLYLPRQSGSLIPAGFLSLYSRRRHSPLAPDSVHRDASAKRGRVKKKRKRPIDANSPGVGRRRVVGNNGTKR